MGDPRAWRWWLYLASCVCRRGGRRRLRMACRALGGREIARGLSRRTLALPTGAVATRPRRKDAQINRWLRSVRRARWVRGLLPSTRRGSVARLNLVIRGCRWCRPSGATGGNSSAGGVGGGAGRGGAAAAPPLVAWAAQPEPGWRARALREVEPRERAKLARRPRARAATLAPPGRARVASLE